MIHALTNCATRLLEERRNKKPNVLGRTFAIREEWRLRKN